MDGIEQNFTAGNADGPSAGGRSSRDSLFLTAPLRLGDEVEAHEVRIRNLSQRGVMAEIDRAVPVGTAASLVLRGIGAVQGRVAWCTEGRVGIALNEVIDPRRARKPVGNGTTTPFYAKSVPR